MDNDRITIHENEIKARVLKNTRTALRGIAIVFLVTAALGSALKMPLLMLPAFAAMVYVYYKLNKLRSGVEQPLQVSEMQITDKREVDYKETVRYQLRLEDGEWYSILKEDYDACAAGDRAYLLRNNGLQKAFVSCKYSLDAPLTKQLEEQR